MCDRSVIGEFAQFEGRWKSARFEVRRGGFVLSLLSLKGTRAGAHSREGASEDCNFDGLTTPYSIKQISGAMV
jgi:hypothetical protein